jgi:hypothetical protein
MARQMTETARLNEELSRAQLAVLRGQMDPHFMLIVAVFDRFPSEKPPIQNTSGEQHFMKG